MPCERSRPVCPRPLRTPACARLPPKRYLHHYQRLGRLSLRFGRPKNLVAARVRRTGGIQRLTSQRTRTALHRWTGRRYLDCSVQRSPTQGVHPGGTRRRLSMSLRIASYRRGTELCCLLLWHRHQFRLLRKPVSVQLVKRDIPSHRRDTVLQVFPPNQRPRIDDGQDRIPLNTHPRPVCCHCCSAVLLFCHEPLRPMTTDDPYDLYDCCLPDQCILRSGSMRVNDLTTNTTPPQCGCMRCGDTSSRTPAFNTA
ncbi:hypothetical protein FKP32DRAFT_588356 [Trametes sanguinea]|nr:hypothetical protein FKP32DRAFT_588356 [Trametes sanguinea]